ncbi:MAG: hypothetical protein KJO40_05355 [Deltaproteobacteria bacterium]|nr:hypothetical protein [Deltaproteobacteria bacterium]NND28091.1 hypothetical protein [Myxococcales bacterium]MBT8463281.1 hypothetical protein [Deltaproteobacteria bacterium]MBT8482178.1 hypothetical protein [Deltaproteobacteria bacterium]NNK09484.1 hypothetical protein [Myxococcales bacterium]
MIRSEGARRVIALIAVAAAALAQDMVVSKAGANHFTSAPALLSADLLLDGAPPSAGATASAGQPYGVRLSPFALTAPTASTPLSKTVPTRLTWLNISEVDPGAGGSVFGWPVNRDSAGAPVVLNSNHTAPLITVSF